MPRTCFCHLSCYIILMKYKSHYGAKIAEMMKYWGIFPMIKPGFELPKHVKWESKTANIPGVSSEILVWEDSAIQ
jgi:hypothetical protein